MPVNEAIFKTYDIRGTYPSDFPEDTVDDLMRAVIQIFSPKSVILGRDARNGSAELAPLVIEECLSAGVNVSDVGIVSTPRLYYGYAIGEFDLGIMLTASHDVKEHAGFKFVINGYPPTAEQMEQIKALTLNAPEKIAAETTRGQLEQWDMTADYIQELNQFVETQIKPLKVVIDCGNNINGPIARHVFDHLGLGEVTYLLEEIDPKFPEHENNPKIARNRELLKRTVLEKQADLGIIWDGDGDRVYFIDGQGKVIEPSFVAAIIGRFLIESDDRKKMTIEVRTAPVVKDLVSEVGGEVIVIPAWHTQIKYLMAEDPQILFGSETSGHYVFRDFHRIDDGLLAALRLIEAVSTLDRSLPETLVELRSKYFIIEESNFSVPDSTKALDELAKKYASGEQNRVDGLTVTYSDWRFNLRPSRTEPYVRLNLSADSAELRDQKRNEITQEILDMGGQITGL